jgi:hypothetical protein
MHAAFVEALQLYSSKTGVGRLSFSCNTRQRLWVSVAQPQFLAGGRTCCLLFARHSNDQITILGMRCAVKQRCRVLCQEVATLACMRTLLAAVDDVL